MPLSSRGGRTWLKLAAVTVVVGAALWLSVELREGYTFLFQTPYQGYLDSEVTVSLDPGCTAEAAAIRLEDAGIVASARFFVHFLKWQDWTHRVQAGTYRFHRPLTLPEVARTVVRGEVARVTVTLPEGWTASRMFRELESAGIGRYDEYRRLWSDPRRVADFAPEARTLEGYLFPDTYEVPAGMRAEELTAVLVNRFREVALPLLVARGIRTRWNTHQLVTLASLVEKEAGASDERPLVASVFVNRLERGMRLQCDPTVIYAEWLAKGEWDGEINRSDLARQSPYNTYLNSGLPPGPVANPGRGAIMAAIKPASSNYLYFVSMNNGRHLFSDNLREHNRAVKKYQR